MPTLRCLVCDRTVEADAEHPAAHAAAEVAQRDAVPAPPFLPEPLPPVTAEQVSLRDLVDFFGSHPRFIRSRVTHEAYVVAERPHDLKLTVPSDSTRSQTTVVSARTRLVRNSFASAALANSASLSPSTAAGPHRLVSLINVVGCGTAPSSGIRRNRRQVNESLPSDVNLPGTPQRSGLGLIACETAAVVM